VKEYLLFLSYSTVIFLLEEFAYTTSMETASWYTRALGTERGYIFLYFVGRAFLYNLANKSN
jgi:hypothetical protein